MLEYCRYLLLSLCALGALTEAARAADATDCKLSSLASLDMQIMADGLVSIPVGLQGKEFRFQVGTAAGNTISADAVNSLGLHARGTASLHGAGALLLDHYVVAPDFSIGQMHGKDLTFWVDNSQSLGSAGIVGQSLLQSFDVDFDFAGGKFNLLSPDHCPGKVVYWAHDNPAAVVPMKIDDGGNIIITVMLDGKPTKAEINTGATTSLMSLRRAHSDLGIDENSTGMTSHDVTINGAVGKAYVYPFKAMTFEGVSITTPHILILNDPNVSDVMTLGMGILRQLHLYIAYKERNLYVTPATAHRLGN